MTTTTKAAVATLTGRDAFVLDATLQGSYPATYAEDGTSVGDLFGFGLAVDGSDLFVGAPASRVQGNDDAGASYFFRRNGGTLAGVAWQQSQLPFVLPVSYDQTGFGRYAAGDGWAFVPLPGTPDDLPGRDAKDFSGELLVFRKDGDCEGGEEWKLFQKIANPDPNPGRGDRFGSNVSYSRGRIIVSGISATSTPYVYDYRPAAGLWLQTAKLDIPRGPSDLTLILDVLIRDDWAFVGFAPFGEAASFVAVFKLFAEDGACGSAGWRRTQVLHAYDALSGSIDFFGLALALDDSTLAVGAPSDGRRDPGGAVYIFQLCDGRWLAAQKIYDDAPPGQVATGSGFGFRVALRGGLLAIADPFRAAGDTSAQGVVALYAKDRCTKEWLPTGDLFVDPDGFENEFFGAGAVVLTDDFLVASNNLQPVLLSPPRPTTNNPGRVVVWRRLCDNDGGVEHERHRRHRHHYHHHPC
jgi:hypothetical protein